MPDSYDLLVRLLTLAPHRVSAAGEINLAVAEAQGLRACGFLTAAAGSWKIAPLPDWIVRCDPQCARLRLAPPAQTAVIASPQTSGEA